MASNINHLIPVQDSDVVSSEIRSNFAAAKTEIEALQVDVASKQPTITAGSITQYYRGDKTFRTLDKAAVGLSNVDDTADSAKNVLTATKLFAARLINGVAFDGSEDITINAVDSTARISSTEKGAANGVATLGADSKIPTSQLPALAVVNTYVVNSQAAQLALTTQEGDVAVRTDLNKTFIRLSTNLGTMADWQEMLTPTDTVLSVNGQTGAITLTTTNIAEGTNQYFTAQRVRDALLTGLSVATNAVVVAADSFLVAIGKLQAQITSLINTKLNSTYQTINASGTIGTVNLVTAPNIIFTEISGNFTMPTLSVNPALSAGSSLVGSIVMIWAAGQTGSKTVTVSGDTYTVSDVTKSFMLNYFTEGTTIRFGV